MFITRNLLYNATTICAAFAFGCKSTAAFVSDMTQSMKQCREITVCFSLLQVRAGSRLESLTWGWETVGQALCWEASSSVHEGQECKLREKRKEIVFHNTYCSCENVGLSDS